MNTFHRLAVAGLISSLGLVACSSDGGHQMVDTPTPTVPPATTEVAHMTDTTEMMDHPATTDMVHMTDTTEMMDHSATTAP